MILYYLCSISKCNSSSKTSLISYILNMWTHLISIPPSSPEKKNKLARYRYRVKTGTPSPAPIFFCYAQSYAYKFFSAINVKSTNLFSSTAIISCANYSLNLLNLGSVFSSFKTTCSGILVNYALNVDGRFICSGGRCYVGCYVVELLYLRNEHKFT